MDPTTVSGQCHCLPLIDKFKGENTVCTPLHWLWELHCCSKIYLDQIILTAKIPKIRQGEECGKNPFKV